MQATTSRHSFPAPRIVSGVFLFLLAGGLIFADIAAAFTSGFSVPALLGNTARGASASGAWPAAVSTTVVAQVSSNTDDVFDLGTGIFDYVPSSPQVRLGKSLSRTAQAGFRFTNLVIPQDATILTAELQLKSEGEFHDFPRFRIYGHNHDNSPPFTSATRPGNRLGNITVGVDWVPDPNWWDQTWYASPDLKDIVQAIVGRAGWTPGNALTLLVIDNGSPSSMGRNVVAYELDPLSAAKLVITYTTPTTATPTSTSTPTETIPPTATFTPTQTTTPTATFTPTETTTPTATFTPSPTATGTVVTSTPTSTASPSRTPTSTSTHTPTQTATATPVLTSTPTPTITQTPTQVTLILPISAPNDDVYDLGTDFFSYFPDTTVIRLGKSGGKISRAGFRFTMATIPKGSIISHAELQVKNSGTNFDPVYWKIMGHNHDNSPAFTQASRPSNRLSQVTTARVDWDPGFWFDQQWNSSPELKDILQEIIDRPGWYPGNALTLLIIDDGSLSNFGRYVYSFDANPFNPGDAARLVITYSGGVIVPTHTPTPTSSPTVTASPTTSPTPTTSTTAIPTFTPSPTGLFTSTLTHTPTPSATPSVTSTPPPTLGGIRGYVTCHGSPEADVIVYAYDSFQPAGYVVLGITDPTGSYNSGLSLLPGTYRVVAVKRGFAFSPSQVYVRVEAGVISLQNFYCY